MINAGPINSAPLNSLAYVTPDFPDHDPGPEPGPDVPEYVVRGFGFQWRLRVIVGGVDMSDLLTGTVTIDREEGAAAIAQLQIYVADSPVLPLQWLGRSVTIDYISKSLGVITEVRRFTGSIIDPVWSPESRLMTCECSDRLQQRVEALSVATIDALTLGLWSADVHEPVEGRSRWDYALERMESRAASLDCSPSGELRTTSWLPVAPSFHFGPGTTLDQSVDVQLAPLSGAVNRVEIEVSYRYPRLWQFNETYTWTHPDTENIGGIGGFCAWRARNSELPTIDMVQGAANNAGQVLVSASYYLLPLTMPNPCGDEVPWLNTVPDLLLGATWTSARRWVQTVTETYRLTLATPAGVSADERVVQRTGYSLQIESPIAEGWVDALNALEFTGAIGIGGGDLPAGNIDGTQDLSEESRRRSMLEVALWTARAELYKASRGARAFWSVPTSMAMDVDLVHTLSLDDQRVVADGKCARIVDTFDHLAGTAITQISIALMSGGGESSALTVPGRLGLPDDEQPGTQPQRTLPTQLAEAGADPYDDELDGFAGNYTSLGATEQFPRRLTAPASELPAEDRDEKVYELDRFYSVGVPENTLEM